MSRTMAPAVQLKPWKGLSLHVAQSSGRLVFWLQQREGNYVMPKPLSPHRGVPGGGFWFRLDFWVKEMGGGGWN